MKRKKIILATLVLLVIASGGVVLAWLRLNQKLGEPGIRARAIPGTVKMDFDLPEYVLDFISTNVPQSEVVTNTLPADTSYAQRLYRAPDGWEAIGNVILMGADRTSIHKPEYCLAGQGWRVLEKTTTQIPIAGAPPYTIEVGRWTISRMIKTKDGQQEQRGLYVFWFVAPNEETSSHWWRNVWQMRDLMRTGVLQRWAYVSYMTGCAPGKEDAVFERMKRLITASVPQFQLAPETAGRAVAENHP